MPSIFDAAARSQLIARMNRLRPEQSRLWGKMNCAQMLCHVADQLRNALGELEAKPLRSPLALPPINWLVIHVLPWPKGKAESPPEFLARIPESWEHDVAALKELIRRAAERGPTARWPESPVFGRISPRAWGVLVHKHLDHHLRQFGV